MPVPGPRTQDRPLIGYRNPEAEAPDRLNLWKRPGPVAEPGRTPGTMVVNLRGNVLGAGTVRRLWKQTADYIAAQRPYSWTTNSPAPGRQSAALPGFAITRAIRYATRNLYVGAGVDNSRYTALHTKVRPRVNSKPVTINAGGVRNRPTVRNRLTSFGSRVTPLNSRVAAAASDEK